MKAQHSQRELEKRLFHLKTLYDVTREIGPLRDIQEIIENLLLMVMGAFGALSGVILLVEINKGRIEAITQRGLDESFMDKLSEAKESDYFLKEMKDGATLQMLGGSDKNQKKGRCDISGLLSSFNLHIWSPFEVNNDLRGGIGLGEKLSGDPYTPDDQELLPESCTEYTYSYDR